VAAKKNPAPRAAGRAPKKFLSLAAMNNSNDTPGALSVQLNFIARRVGSFDPATLAVVASIVFGGARA